MAKGGMEGGYTRGIAFHEGATLEGEPFEALQLFWWILMQLFLPLWN